MRENALLERWLWLMQTVEPVGWTHTRIGDIEEIAEGNRFVGHYSPA
jgi:hypothetical protein